jgi:hypothetical protein
MAVDERCRQANASRHLTFALAARFAALAPLALGTAVRGSIGAFPLTTLCTARQVLLKI